jgi:putative ABC transport system ATP-binding protein
VALCFGPLDGVNLRVAAGELVGVVAPRAAEAEALVKVLAATVPPDAYSGAVLVGGQRLDRLDVDQARRVLLVEPHRADLFTGSLRTNINAGDAGPVELGEALRAAAADEVVAAHPDGLDHEVAERGVSLSGGQRQRLALARALLAAPPILVLHDPTTAVDPVTEHAIAHGLRALRRARTTVVVTSSPALLAVTDRVVVLDGGRVVACGRHAELGETDEAYRRAVLR